MLETVLNPNPLVMIGYLCFVGTATAAAAIAWWNRSKLRQQWTAQEPAARLRGAR